jgi:putative protease
VNTQPASSHLELLAPAGDMDCVRAALENGADAIYFGLDRGFNARARAGNLSLDNLPKLMRLLHERGVRGYVTLNTLVFSDELAEFQRIVREVADAGADAVLVQDLGAARLVRAICPELPIHASTQMTLTSAECIAVAEELGIERVVLARELALEEIRQITAATRIPVEVFAHGALCVAYSGQCLTSESLGGRSANRGQCAQACRLPYEVFCDGEPVPLDRVKFLLSPQDLAAYELVPELRAAGVASLKIEGRLKAAEYVASITRHYRHAIDTAEAGGPVKLTQEQSDEMELTFSRGFSPGWLEGCDHKRLVPGVSSAKRGLRLGTVERVIGERVRARLERPVKPGDGLMFDTGREQNEQPGGRVYEIRVNNRRVEAIDAAMFEFELAADGQVHADEGADATSATIVADISFAYGALPLEELTPGQVIWKTDDPALLRQLRRSFSLPDPQHTRPLDVEVVTRVGEPMRWIARVGTNAAPAGLPDSESPAAGPVVEVVGDKPLEAARKHPLSEETLREQLGRLGHTPFHLRRLDWASDGSPMVPLSVMGEMRRQLVEKLTDAMVTRPPRRIALESVLPSLRPDPALVADRKRVEPQLHVLCRTLAQLDVLLAAGYRRLSVDFADIREYREAVARGREAGADVWLATPRIQKPGELGVFHAMRRHEPAGILARNLAAIRYFVTESVPVVADYSLNVANELTARFVRELGVDYLTASYDLNRDQMTHLVAATPADWLEVVIHQHMPMFHMEHCVFCAVLSPGTNKTNCGRPCDTHVVHLQDRVGMQHLLTADVGCRNTLFNATAQSGAEVVPELLRAGVHRFRVELLEEKTSEEVLQVVELYGQLLRGEVRGVDVWSRLRAMNRIGVTRGTLEERRDPLALL